MEIRLQNPINFGDATIRAITLRVPAQHLWDANPPGILQSHWNLAHFAGIPVEAVPLLSEADVDSIGEAQKLVMAEHNRGVIGSVPLSRQQRRHLERESMKAISALLPEREG